MAGFLAHLVRRSTTVARPVRPRPISVFETSPLDATHDAPLESVSRPRPVERDLDEAPRPEPIASRLDAVVLRAEGSDRGPRAATRAGADTGTTLTDEGAVRHPPPRADDRPAESRAADDSWDSRPATTRVHRVSARQMAAGASPTGDPSTTSAAPPAEPAQSPPGGPGSLRLPGTTAPPPFEAEPRLAARVATPPHRMPAVHVPAPPRDGSPAAPILVPRLPRAEAAPRRERLLAPDTSDATVHVTIGRVEIRAVAPPAAQKRTGAAAALSLRDYLRRRNGDRP